MTLFPMLHIGEAQFYDAVYSDVLAHDAVLIEGVRSAVVTRITRAYRWINNSNRLDLVVQPRLPLPPSGKPEIIHADLSGEEFEAQWRKVSLPTRLLLYVAAPLFALRMRWFGTRETIARHTALEDLTGRDEILRWSPEYALLGNAVLLARDERLLEVMDSFLDREMSGKRTLAIVYGARHMRAVIRRLSMRGFQATRSDWMTVFST